MGERRFSKNDEVLAFVQAIPAIANGKSPRVGCAGIVRRGDAVLLIDQGQIGKARFAVANIAQHFPSIRPTYREIYFAKKAMGGGTMLPEYGPPDAVAATGDPALELPDSNIGTSEWQQAIERERARRVLRA